MTSDRELIERSVDEPSVFGRLFDRHAAVIHRVVAGRVPTGEADDIVAETFLRAFERRRRYRGDRETALPWLFGFALNVLREHARARRRTVQYDLEQPDSSDRIAAAGNRLDARRELDRVLAALDAMPEGARDAVLLYSVAGLSYEDVAAAQRVSIGTVRSRLHRARAKLRALEAPTSGEEGRHGLDGTPACAP